MNRDEWVRQLREKYANPIKTPDGWLSEPKTYCVGGALARDLGLEVIGHDCGEVTGSAEGGRLRGDLSESNCDCSRTVPIGMFPATSTLADVLCMANPDLTPEVALDFAKLIARKNDTGNFETAWGFLADALGWAPDEAWTTADDASVDAFLTAVTA